MAPGNKSEAGSEYGSGKHLISYRYYIRFKKAGAIVKTDFRINAI